MSTRLLPAAVAGLLAVSLLGLAPASASPPAVPVPDAPATAPQSDRQAAVDALAAVEALAANDPSRASRRQVTGRPDVTMALNQLLRVRADLTPAEKRRADALLARPTADGGDGFLDYSVPEATPVCGPVICIHYVTTTADAPPQDSNDGDAIPDAVQQALATAESVHGTYTGAGYLRPDSDGTLGGGSDQVDVYLGDLGNAGYYGYCTTDQPGDTGPWNRWAYCAIDEDFSTDDFPENTPLENQQVTLAHEYFHAVQYAYDAYEDPWFLEATAAWAEDELFDAVDDNRQYLPSGQLGRPYLPLDLWVAGDSMHYGNWLFFRHLTERWTAETGGLPTIMVELMERLSGRTGDPDQYSTQAIAAELAERGTSFGAVYARFVTDNRAPARAYSEGARYRPAAPLRTWRLRADRRRTGLYEIRIDHLSNIPLRYRPGSGTSRRGWKLRLQVDMPAGATAPAARVVSFLKGGGVSTETIRLSSTGKGARTVPFSSRRVRYVELVLINASRRTSCWTYPYGDSASVACNGTPRDDNVRTLFSASISR
ncbi:MXAN_6640 family putative metalloprotease [Nocardioides euryhalodurans]|uniref:Uncharacterized protein n=1 Tax=Nocardioides euryhalodurans TaxID=2518370 RepID=A0A4P7GJS2_9ACTN|nr:MXAN_6640 family putative metalloprotease [Nocardioides euryhalodurans]QBR92288.1 hypothetical protein EXE57_08290 [Nocardioides euryhalodurans]